VALDLKTNNSELFMSQSDLKDPSNDEFAALGALVEYGSQLSLPLPVKKNLLKALDQLCSAAVDIPIAWLEGLAAERRAETEGRLKVIRTAADKIASGSGSLSEYAEVASRRAAAKIVREQVNLQKIAEIAVSDIASSRLLLEKPEQEARSEEKTEVGSEWLNAFEREASEKTSDEMRAMFGKVLAEEIRRPTSFSVKTVRLIGQLDPHVAKLFQRLCSLSVSFEIGTNILDARVCGLDGQAGLNSLKDWGLHFDALNLLHEHGLIVPDYNCWVDYAAAIARDGRIAIPCRFADKQWAFMSTKEGGEHTLKMNGVSLSKSGKELFRIVDKVDSSGYLEHLQEFLGKKDLKMVELSR